MGLTGRGIKTVGRLFCYVPLILLGAAGYRSAFQPAQLEAFETVLRGWLLFKSEFLPRFLAVLSVIGGIGWLTWLWPQLGSQTFTAVAIFAIAGVIATSGWLFIRGVDDPKWRQRAALAATSIWR